MRLTKRDGGGNAVMDCDNCEIKYQEGCCSKQLCRNGLINKLAAYEDTGYTPLEIKSLESEWNAMRAVVDSYRNAEKQGLLVRLPCKVGDTVYKLWYEPCHFGNAHPDGIDCDGCEDTCDIKQAVVECKAINIEWIIHNMMCKRPFAYTTREEAENALKGERKDV